MWWKRNTANELLAIIARLEEENANLRLETRLTHEALVAAEKVDEDQQALIREQAAKIEDAREIARGMHLILVREGEQQAFLGIE